MTGTTSRPEGAGSLGAAREWTAALSALHPDAREALAWMRPFGSPAIRPPQRQSAHGRAWITRQVLRNWEPYLIALLPVLYFVVFRYLPMYGAQIAFRKFSPSIGIWKSPWVGLDQFARFFASSWFLPVLSNTILLSVYELAAGFSIRSRPRRGTPATGTGSLGCAERTGPPRQYTGCQDRSSQAGVA